MKKHLYNNYATICTIKEKYIRTFSFTLFCILITIGYSQPIATPPSTAALAMNTGVALNTFTPVTPGSLDPAWKVSNSSMGGGFISAQVVNVPFNPCCSWSPNQTSGGAIPYSQWITMPYMSCGSPTSYSCQPAFTDAFFERSIFLTSSVYQTDWLVYSSGYLVEVTVNTFSVYQNLSTYPPSNPPCNATGAINIRTCKNFKAGWNTIQFHVKMPQSIPSNCKNLGLRVESYGGTYPTIAGTTPVCINSTYLYSVPGPAGGSTYSWTFPPGWAAAGGTPSFAISRKATALAANGVLTLNISNATGCVGAAQYNISVDPPLKASASSTVLCKGASTNIYCSNGVPGTYTIAGPGLNPPGTPSINISPPFFVTPPISTNYTVLAKTPSGCTYSTTIGIIVMPGPNIGIFNSNGNNPVCAGLPVALTAMAYPGITNVTGPWFWGPAIPSSSTNANPVTVSPTVNTQYCVTAKGVNGCYSSSCITITTIPVPTITAVSNPSVVCPGTSALLTASGANTYTWAAPINSNLNPVTVYPTSTTVYTVSGTATTNTCVSSATVAVQTATVPQITINPALICPGITNTLTAIGGATSFTWIAFPQPGIPATGPVYTINPASTTTVFVYGFAPNSCYTTTQVVLAGGPPNTITVPNLTVCSSASTCATWSASTNYTSAPSFTWSTPGGTPMSGSQVTICPAPGTSSLFTIQASSAAGCSVSTTALVTSYTNCCIQPTAGLSVLGNSIGGTYPPGSYLLNQSATLSLTTNFIDAEVWITPSVQITVPPGTVLDLDKVHLFACSNIMWKGIVVQDGGRIKTSNARKYSSLIEDAEVAIDLDQISTIVPGRPAIDVSEVIFNKNYIAIKISNSTPTLNVLPLGINGCVFSSRTITFTSFPQTVLSWPLDNMLPGGLRAANNPTTGLLPPHTFPGFAQTNLKQPFTNQPAHIGIKIDTIGDQGGCMPAAGVEWGYTYTGFITNNFNLFDGLGTGIEITDASLITHNNVFQNMQHYYNTPSASMYGGDGIKHTTTTFMLSALDLSGGGTTDDGNRFYNCVTGINAKNVYKFTSLYNIFRSTHLSSTPFAVTPLQGEGGIVYESNRFSFNAYGNEFNNIKYGIKFSTPNGIFGYNHPNCAGIAIGVLANMFNISNNYFGAEVTSTTPYSGALSNTEYMYKGIEISTPNIFGWTNSGQNNYISSNKFDRVFNGVTIDGFADEPLTVGGNRFLIEDDQISQANPTATLQFGQGIGTTNNMGNLTIEQNTLQAMGSAPGSNSVSLVFAETNYGISSPRIFCNYSSKSNFGYHFSGQNKGTVWEGNHMCNNFAGYALTNNGEIGTQGSSTNGSDNFWDYLGTCQAWSTLFASWETYVDGTSIAANSPVYTTTITGFNPTNNFASFPSQPYMPPISIVVASAPTATNIDCYLSNPYMAGPSWKNGKTEIAEYSSKQLLNLQILPNPSCGKVQILFSNTIVEGSLRVLDLEGSTIFFKMVHNTNSEELDLTELSSGIYFLELTDKSHGKLAKKLVINSSK